VSWQGWQLLPSNGGKLKMAIIIKLGSWGSPRKRKVISHNGMDEKWIHNWVLTVQERALE
jgi:hypothetical protein